MVNKASLINLTSYGRWVGSLPCVHVKLHKSVLLCWHSGPHRAHPGSLCCLHSVSTPTCFVRERELGLQPVHYNHRHGCNFTVQTGIDTPVGIWQGFLMIGMNGHHFG